MAVIKKTQNTTTTKKNDDFYYLESSRLYISGESKSSVLFYKKVNETLTNYTWVPKQLIFKSEYSLRLKIHLPKKWVSYSFYNSKGETYDATNIDDYCKACGFVLKS